MSDFITPFGILRKNLRPGGQTATRSAAAVKQIMTQVVDIFMGSTATKCDFAMEAMGGGAEVSGTLTKIKKVVSKPHGNDGPTTGINLHFFMLPNTMTFPGGREELNEAVRNACNFDITGNIGNKSGPDKRLSGKISARR